MRLLFLIAVTLLTGCATRIQVDYMSDPPGATLYEEGRPIGVAPMSWYYEPDASFKSGGCLRAKGITAIWASGAKAEIGYLDACQPQGWVQNYWFRRPEVPGREVDMNYALQLQRNGIMRAQAAATMMNALTPPAPVQPYQVQPYVIPTRPTTNCRSYRIGDQVNTTCQ